jgi:GAF domain-containing protein/HAMP domain-containing protein
MLAFRNLRIGAKLTLLITIAVLGFAAFAAYALYTLGIVQVNGPVYQGLTKDQELVADILPPSSYIVEPYLLTWEILDAAEDNDLARVNALTEKVAKLQADFEKRHAYWAETLASTGDAEITQTLLVESYEPAKTYFEIFNDQFLPAIRQSQSQKAHDIFHDQMIPVYETHRAAIDKVVLLQRKAIANDELKAQTLVSRSTFLLILLAVSTVALAAGFGVFIARSVTLPIGQLTQVANQVIKGDLEARASSDTTDEVGVLSRAFNQMTAQLRDTFQGLEQRVAERTRNLELAAEVGRTVSQVHALDVMLKDAAELIRKQFDLYYVQVYLADASQTNLILQSGTGNVGEQLISRRHSLPLNTNSINGRAAMEKKSVVISDTTASATFKPNPLLPDTRSEMAVPLMLGDKVVGVLDMQSEHAGSLSQENLPAFEALAGQLAIAIQNANLLAEAEQARVEVEAQARRLSRSNWVEYLDAIHKPEETGFVFEQNKIAPLTHEEPAKENDLTAPIAVSGETLGKLVVEMEGQSPIAHTDELVNTVARQVSQQIEALRLLESADRFRYEAEQATRRLTHEGWQEYKDTAQSLGYLYDLNEVRPYSEEKARQVQEVALDIPLKVHDEVIGKVVIHGVQDEESISFANAVAERLGAHIEGLRLSMQTEQALSTTKKLAQREQALRQITNAVRGSTDPTVILRTAARELGNLLGRKAIVRLTTTHEAQANQDHPADLAENSAVKSENELVSPAESSKADGGNE